MVETLGVEPGPDMPTSVAAYLEENADVWDQIVAKYDLRSRNLRELVGQGDQHADFAFAYGAPEGPRAFVSTIKLRQAGFTKTIAASTARKKCRHRRKKTFATLSAQSGHKALRWLQLWASAAKAAGRSRTRNERRLHVFAACH
jgi:hypothetical protein